MFARLKQSGKYHYLQLVENRREANKIKQRVVSTVGRIDQLQQEGKLENIIGSLARFSQKMMLLVAGSKSKTEARVHKVGPVLIFGRLWEEAGIKETLRQLLEERKFEFDVERALFVATLHRLMAPGSDRAAKGWMRQYRIGGTDELELHHFYRAMAWLGEELPRAQQKDASALFRRCVKDLVEEKLFLRRRDLFSQLEMVFFDTTSLYFEGDGGETIGAYGYSKDHRPDRKQMVLGAVLDAQGYPICCEMWPGNTSDARTLLPVVDRLGKRFQIQRVCVVADRGMISEGTMEELEKRGLQYILGARMRQQKEIGEDLLSSKEGYEEVRPQRSKAKDPAPLKVKEIRRGGRRYVLCLNEEERTTDARNREVILSALEDRLKAGAGTLVGNKGFRKYLKVEKGAIRIDRQKAAQEEIYDGKWLLRTNTELGVAEVALKYKQLMMVEQLFRDTKSLLATRPIFHKCDETIRGHVFCSFLALVLREELNRRLEKLDGRFEWAEVKRDLKALAEVEVQEGEKKFAVRSECVGTCGKVFQAVGVAMPPTVRQIT
ncbi:MAG: IS1634 family transposase [Candidatus Eisenbacteria bacterium]|nr:IS1634 family transposase [Candidatus Eisenbacteria bacterium]